jgi:hypothetical protein
MSPTNGRITVWQDGILIMDLAAPGLDTYNGHYTGTNPTGGMVMENGFYIRNNTQLQRMYWDHFKVSDVYLDPGTSPLLYLPPLQLRKPAL